MQIEYYVNIWAAAPDSEDRWSRTEPIFPGICRAKVVENIKCLFLLYMFPMTDLQSLNAVNILLENGEVCILNGEIVDGDCIDSAERGYVVRLFKKVKYVDE